MKNLISILIFVFDFQLIGLTQNYTPFPTINGFWRVHYSSINCLDGCGTICSDYQYILNDDTIIGTNTYKKVYQSGKNCYWTGWTGVWNYWNGGYIGALRDDSSNKRVFYIQKDSATETLLYDYNLNIGDSLPSSLVYRGKYSMDSIKVDSIDYILVNGQNVKRFHLAKAGWGQEYLIEGMGSTLGLLEPIQPFFEEGHTLLCFKNDSTPMYVEDSFYCSIITSIAPTKEKQKLTIEIVPNPVNNISKLEILGLTTTDYKIEIFNVLGQKIKCVLTQNETFLFYKNDFNMGLYFLRVIDNSSIIGQLKFIVN